jgi:hypothetical protein
VRRIVICFTAAFAVLALAAALGACGAKDIQTPTGTIDIAKDQAVKAQLMMIKTGVTAYVQMNGVAPPNADAATLGSFVQPWPKNPWTQAPMKSGKEPGDIAYAPGAGTAYTLGVVTSDGTVYNAP